MVLDFIYQHYHHRLQSWNLSFLQPHVLRNYINAKVQKSVSLNNCFSLVDNILTRICRHNLNQRRAYNGHKKVHGIKFHSMISQNNLIGNLVGSWEYRRHDCLMLYESGLQDESQGVASFNGQPRCIYGDPAYPMRIDLPAPYRFY